MSTKKSNMHVSSEPLLSPEEIKNFVTGKVTKKEKKRIEHLIASHDFLADAVDGFRKFPNEIDSIPDNPYLPKTKTVGWKGVLFGTLVIAGLGYWFTSGNTRLDKSVVQQNENPVPIENKVYHEEKNQDPAPVVLIESFYSDSGIQIKTRQRNTDNKIIPGVKKKFERINRIPVDRLPDSLKLVTTKNPDSLSTTLPEIKPTVKKKFDIYHIADYRVYDYRGKRKDLMEILNPVLDGTPANLDNPSAVDKYHSPVIQINYSDYLKDAIILFSKKNYREANKHFKIILKKYPDDINALFYQAMSSYNSGKNKRAIQEFEKVLEQPISMFDEDAEFFLAKAFRANNQRHEADLLLKKIAAGKGFYSDQAGELLK